MSFHKKNKVESITGNENITVALRCRPRNDYEKKMESPEVIDCNSEKKEVVYKNERNNHFEEKKFVFDRVFGPDSKQIEVYKQVVEPLVNHVLMGYSCTIFAYGQTGTGKTFTMEGERSSTQLNWDKDPLSGIIPRCIHQLFDSLHKSPEVNDFTVRVSFLEIYNEELFDLLGGSLETTPRPRMFEDSSRKGAVIINGLEEVLVKHKNDVYKIIEKGSSRRQNAATLLNARSSRSHTVFTVTVNIKESGFNDEFFLRTGKLYLVDLAGSENIGRSGAIDKRAREAGTINQSLLTLGRVINALLDKSSHVPYRESKLTRLLQDSLGGKCKTCIIATISPALYNIEETLSTLEYGSRAKRIKNKPQVNQKQSRAGMIREFTENIAKLKLDLQAARERNGMYMTPESYNELQSTVLVHKEIIMTLEANVCNLEEELEHTKQLFGETQEKLAKKDTDVYNAKKWIHYIREELLDSINTIKKQSFRIEQDDFALNKFEQVQHQLYEQAKHLKEKLKLTLDKVNKFNKKLKIERQNSNKVYNSALEYQHQLNGVVGSYLTDIELLYSLLNEIGNQLLVFMQDFQSCSNENLSNISQLYKNHLNQISEIQGLLQNSFEYVLNEWKTISYQNITSILDCKTKNESNLDKYCHLKEQLDTKLRDIIINLKDTHSEFFNQQLNQIFIQVDDFIVSCNNNFNNNYQNTEEILSLVHKDLKKSVENETSNVFNNLESTFLNHFNGAMNELTVQINQAVLSKYNYLKEIVQEEVKLVLSHFTNQFERFYKQTKDLIKNNEKLLQDYSLLENHFKTTQKTLRDIQDSFKSSEEVNIQKLEDLINQSDNIKNDMVAYNKDIFLSLYNQVDTCNTQSLSCFNEKHLLHKENIEKFGKCGENYMTTVLSLLEQVNQKQYRSVVSFKEKQENINKDILQTLEKQQNYVSNIPEKFNLNIMEKMQIYQTKGGDTPHINEKSLNESIHITEPQGRSSLLKEFDCNENVTIEPIFPKLENIIDTTTIPEFDVDKENESENFTEILKECKAVKRKHSDTSEECKIFKMVKKESLE